MSSVNVFAFGETRPNRGFRYFLQRATRERTLSTHSTLSTYPRSLPLSSSVELMANHGARGMFWLAATMRKADGKQPLLAASSSSPLTGIRSSGSAQSRGPWTYPRYSCWACPALLSMLLPWYASFVAIDLG